MQALAPTGLITFRVDGIPAPKGSMSAFAVRKAGKPTGRVVVTQRGSDKQTEWTMRMHAVVQDVAREQEQLVGPVSVTVRFHLPKPKSAPKSKRFPDKMPDIDKLVRLVLDAITGTLIEDDARVVYLQAIKQYADEGARPGADISLWPMEVR